MAAESSRVLPKVLVVGPFPPTKGGVTTFMLNLMSSELKERFAFLPFTTSRPPKKNTIDNYGYAAMLRGGVGRVLSGAAITLWHLASFPWIVATRGVHLVQVQASDYQAFWESAAYVWMAKRMGKPVVLRIGGAFDLFFAASSPRLQRLIARVLEQPDWLIAQSETASGFIRSAGRRGPIVVVPNWSRDGSIRTVERAPRQDPVFLFVAGSDARRKGIEEVLEAAARLQAKASGARLHVMACAPVLQSRIEASGLRNIVQVEGFVENRRVIEAMCAADVLLLPSHGEGFPNTLVEAMGCGLPAIVTPVGGVPEIISGGGAVSVPVADAAALAQAMEALAEDGELRLSMGRAAIENLKRRYVESVAVAPLGQVYDRLIAEA